MRIPQTTFPGGSSPLGATWDGRGVNFALFAENATGIDLCVFDTPYGKTESGRIPLVEKTANVWHAYLPEARPGLLYGYRAHGAYEPVRGLRYNANKLLIDPYAKALTGGVQWSDAMFAYPPDGRDDRDLFFNEADSAPGMPKCIVVDNGFSWGNDRPPAIPWNATNIYEAHVRGLTIQHPGVPPEIRGSYEGMAHQSVVGHLQDLGVTAVELMPVHHFVDDRHLLNRGLSNYWGYNTIGFFAPDTRYAFDRSPGQVVREFKTMVRVYHEAGIEVILDVVYNHTAEGNHYGPTLAFRGLDNPAYYRLKAEDERLYQDYTGTGNTLNMLHPRTIQLIMDSLRYWVLEMHVDGFRFDLASTLARELHDVDRLSAFFDIIHQDPILSEVKLIAEPWDLGDGGYQVGNFPVLWAEWNGKYRDCVRRFWRGDPGQLAELGYRLTGSSDLYERGGKAPYASINFITAHDGFTLHDLVSYNGKHNEANGEEDHDGSDNNVSWNCGVEGETTDPEVIELRERQIRNFLSTLYLSQGVPMLLHGDEIQRTQQGNNNGYCQDNEVTWMNWNLGPHERRTLEWTRRLIAFRQAHPVLWREKFFQGRPIRGAGTRDIVWYTASGREMTERDWSDQQRRCMAVWLAGAASDLRDQRGRLVVDDTIFIVFNGGFEHLACRLPAAPDGVRWSLAFNTAHPDRPEGHVRLPGRRLYTVASRSVAVFTHPTAPAQHEFTPGE